MNINFFDEIKKYNNTVDYNFLYVDDFKKGNLTLVSDINDFHNIFGDFNEQSYITIRELLKNNVPINVERVINPASINDISNPIYTRTAHKFIKLQNNFAENTTNPINYYQNFSSNKLFISENVSYQITSDDFVLVSNDINNATFPENFCGFNKGENEISFINENKFNEKIRLYLFEFENVNDNDFSDLSNIQFNGILGLDKTGYKKFRIIILFEDDTFVVKIYGIAENEREQEIYISNPITFENNIGELEADVNNYEITGYIFWNENALNSTDFKFSMNYFDISISNENYKIEQILSQTNNSFNHIFYSNENDFYYYDIHDMLFQNRILLSLSNSQNEPILCFFSKFGGIYGNNINVEIKGKNQSETLLNDGDVIINISYEGVIIETFTTDNFSIESNYVDMIYVENNGDIDVSNINYKFNLENGNNGENDIESWKKSFTRHNYNFNVILLNDYNLDNLELYQYVIQKNPNAIIICAIPKNINNGLFSMSLENKDKICVINDYFYVENYSIPKCFYLLSNFKNIMDGSYSRLLNVSPISNNISENFLIDEDDLKKYNFNYFLFNKLISEKTLSGENELSKVLFKTSLERRLQRILNKVIFSNGTTNEYILGLINSEISKSKISFNTQIISRNEKKIVISIRIKFNKDIDFIVFNLTRLF